MRDVQILQQTLENQCPDIHKKQLRSLMLATKSVLDGSDLTLSKIGRALNTFKLTPSSIVVSYLSLGLVKKYGAIGDIK